MRADSCYCSVVRSIVRLRRRPTAINHNPFWVICSRETGRSRAVSPLDLELDPPGDSIDGTPEERDPEGGWKAIWRAVNSHKSRQALERNAAKKASNLGASNLDALHGADLLAFTAAWDRIVVRRAAHEHDLAQSSHRRTRQDKTKQISTMHPTTIPAQPETPTNTDNHTYRDRREGGG